MGEVDSRQSGQIGAWKWDELKRGFNSIRVLTEEEF